MTKIVEIKNLSIGYINRKNTLKLNSGLNTSLHTGELACLLGANGKGKSTLLKTLCKFIPRLDGNVFIDREPLDAINERNMAKKVSIVLTEKIQVPNATVYELVGYGRSPYTGFMGRLSKNDHLEVEKAIRQCGIAHKKHDSLESLSDGERQKASIAKALAQNTPVILLDEPTAFLDLPSRVEIIKLLAKLAKNSGKAVLMAIHDLDLALQMADKLWLMDSDNFICGSPEDLLYQNAFQKIFNDTGITFDNRSGIFRVEYNNTRVLPVKGHGFEYVLLRRAFAREGIDLVHSKSSVGIWMNIMKEKKNPFQLYKDQSLLMEEHSIENIVQFTLKYLKFEKKSLNESCGSSHEHYSWKN